MSMRMIKRLPLIAVIVLFSAISACFAQSRSDYDDLVALNQRVLDSEIPEVVDGVPDYSEIAVRAKADELKAIKRELSDIDPSEWSVSEKTDYLLVWTKLNKTAFKHNATQPWIHDPLFYIDQIKKIPYTDTPSTDTKRAELSAALDSVPRALDSAKKNLTHPVSTLSKLALFYLDNFDGVAFKEPVRDVPPEGVVGWFEDLCSRLKMIGEDELTAQCAAAAESVVEYRDWLESEIPDMKKTGAIGIENFDWYLKHVRLLPYSREYLKDFGEREFHRYRFLYLVEKNANASLPKLKLTQSAKEHNDRTKAAEEKTRKLVKDQFLFSIPDYASGSFETDVFWSERAKTDRHFWEEIQFRNTLNNHIHASFPGHRFDHMLRKDLKNPIRRSHRESGRSEGWATYLEELFIQAGIADDSPRVNELFYAALIKRGSRFSEIDMHAGNLSFDGVIDYMIDWVPFMEHKIGRFDVAAYVRRPSVGTMYLVGKMQIEKIASERAHQLGDEFKLGKFHDELLTHGMIPLSLIRWEMTGYDDEVRELWPVVTGKPFPETINK